MQVCVAAGVLTAVCWAAWAFTAARVQAHPGRFYMLSFLLAVNAAVLLEVLDFPPLFGPQVGVHEAAHACMHGSNGAPNGVRTRPLAWYMHTM